MITCAICEDDNLCSRELELLVEKYVGFTHIEVELFQNAETFFIRVLDERSHFDIIFIDIQMKHKNGIRIAEMIRRNLAFETNILILITGRGESVLETLELHPFHVLQKPINRIKFGEVFRDALDQSQGMTTIFEFSKHRVLYRIPFHTIYYFISSSHYVWIIGQNKPESMKDKMDVVEQHLLRINTWDFIRIHKSIIVNLNYVKEFQTKGVLMKNGDYLSISDSYLGAYRERMEDYIPRK